MSMTVYVDDRAAPPNEIELDVEELEEVIAPKLAANHNENFVSDEAELSVEEMEEVIAPLIAANHNETLVDDDIELNAEADTRQLLARIQAPEREIGDVRVGLPVRLKVSAYPDQVFLGRVAKIGGESETDQNNQVIYRVELVIENTNGLLRPGMTAFARIDFGRRVIGSILLHKLMQALRPELWMI